MSGVAAGQQTRRAFVKRTALVGATASGAAIGVHPAYAGATSELTQNRQEVFGALVETVGGIPGTAVDPDERGPATSELRRRYGRAPESIQKYVDVLLDGLNEGLGSRSFAALERSARIAHIQARLVDRGGRSGLGPTPAAQTREAVALAAAPFDPNGFRWDSDKVGTWVETVKALPT